MSLFTNRQWGSVAFDSDGCSATPNEVNFLEHVEVIVNIDYPVRGRLDIDLVSPSGKIGLEAGQLIRDSYWSQTSTHLFTSDITIDFF